MKTQICLEKETILRYVSQEDIFEKYLGIRPKYGEQHTNPLREDHKPGCRFYTKGNKIRFVDFSRGWNWDCFDVVKFSYNCDYNMALKIIATDFNILTYDIARQPVTVPRTLNAPSSFKGDKRISIQRKNFTNRDLAFWRLYGITKELLNEYRIVSLATAWVENITTGKMSVVYTHKQGEMGFCYDLGWGKLKLYFPERRIGRFIQTTTKIVEGYLQLPKVGKDLIITKSYKDVVCMRGFDLWAVAASSESIVLPKKFMERMMKSFERIFTLLDNDMRGKRTTILYRRIYGTIPLLFPSELEKDFTDNYREYGLQFMLDYVADIKEYLSSQA